MFKQAPRTLFAAITWMSLAWVSLGLVSLELTPAAEAQQASPAGGTVKLRKNTVLKFSTVQQLGSATARAGDDVPLRLSQALVLDGVTLLPEGAVVNGRVTKVKHSKPSCRDGAVEWKLDRITLAGGSAAQTEVAFVSPQSGAELPKHLLAKMRLGPGFWIFASPLIVAISPLAVAMGPYYGAVELDHRCPGNGNQYVLPANATVGVVVRKNIWVRY